MYGGTALKYPKDKVYDRLASDLPINAVVMPDVVDDPLERGAKLRILRSVRDDPLAGMLSRDQIDQAQFMAGRRWQMFHEHSEIGGVSAIDPSKEAVDGGKIPEPITDRQIVAFRELNAGRKVLGIDGDELIRDVLGKCMSVTTAATMRGHVSKDGRAYVGRRFRECLETLAILWNLASPKRK